MNLTLQIPLHDESLTPYLEAVRGDGWDGIELPGEVMQDESGWEDAIEAFGVPCRGLGDLLPDAVGRYLPETAAAARERLLTYMRRLMTRAAMLNIEYAVIQLGVDRIASGALDAELTARCKLLRSLMALAETHEITVCVPVSLPAPAYRRDLLARTVRLIQEVMHPKCRLALDLRPDELPADFEPADFLRTHGPSIAVLRFHYEPALGLGFTADSQAEWADAVRREHYQGDIVFCPHITGVDAIRRQSRAVAPRLRSTWRGLPDED